MSRLSQAIDANRKNITVVMPSGQSRLSQAIDSMRRGEVVRPQSAAMDRSAGKPHPSQPAAVPPSPKGGGFAPAGGTGAAAGEAARPSVGGIDGAVDAALRSILRGGPSAAASADIWTRGSRYSGVGSSGLNEAREDRLRQLEARRSELTAGLDIEGASALDNEISSLRKQIRQDNYQQAQEKNYLNSLTREAQEMIRRQRLESDSYDIEADRAKLSDIEKQMGIAKARSMDTRHLSGDRRKETRRKYQTEYDDLKKQADSLRSDIDLADWLRVDKTYTVNRDNPDFAEKSRYVSTANGKEAKTALFDPIYLETGFDDINYDYINKNKDALDRQQKNEINTGASFLGVGSSFLNEMTDDEIALFNYLYAQDTANGDIEHKNAYSYIEHIASNLNARQRAKETEKWQKYANEHPVKSSAFSVLTSPLKGFSYIGQAAEYLEDRRIDQNAGYNKFSYIPSSIRRQVSQDIEQTVEGTWGKVGSFAYQTGMSMGDFLLNAAITGGNQALSLAIMGTGAAADATIAAKDRGLSDNQAFTLGTIAGLAEVVTEKVSLEALLKPNWEKGVLNYVLKNAVAEGSEEVASDLINLTADIMISKDKSEWAQSVQAYMDQGYTESEAFGLAVQDQAIAMGLDFVGGALSGGIMSGTAGVGHVIANYQTGKQINSMNLPQADVQSIIDEGLASDPSTQAHTLAVDAQNKLTSGETLTDYEIGNLYQANIRAIEAENAAETLENSLYDFLVGSASGGLGDVTFRGANRALDAATGNTARLLEQAAQEAAQNGQTTNNTAAQILADEAARAVLEADAGLTITEEMTKSQQRAAVKEAAGRLFTAQESARTEGRGIIQERTEARRAYDMGRIQRASSALGENGRKALTATYDGQTDAGRYYGGFAVYYQAGVSGQDLNKVSGEYSGALTPAQQFAAYASGQNDAAASLEREKQAARFAPMAGEESGLVYDDFVREAVESGRTLTDADWESVTDTNGETRAYLSAGTAERINTLAKDLGVRVRFVDSVAGGAANAQIDGSEILVERNNKNPVMAIVGHELTHRMQELAPEAYREFRDLVMQDRKYEGEVQKKIDNAAKWGVTLDTEGAMDEIAADAAGLLMDDGKALDGFIRRNQDNRTVLEKLRDAFRALWQKLTGKEKQKAGEAEKKLTAALEAAVAQAEQNNKNAAQAEGGEVKYSIKNTRNMTLNEQLKAFYDGKLRSSDALYFGETPGALSAIGLDTFPLAITTSDFKKSAKGKHNVPRRVWKNLRADLQTALFAFSDGDRVGILTGDIDGDGKPLLVGIQTGVQMDADKVNAIRSAYGLDNPTAWLKNQIESGKTFALMDEKRANTFLYPYGYSASRKEGISSISDSISESGENVKPRYSLKETDSRGRELTQKQKEFFKDSKVRDSSGQLLVLYHQTEGEFTVFDPLHQGAGTTDSETPFGIFMKPDARDIGLRGKRQMPLYANITNPLTVRNRESLAAWYRENIPGYQEAEAKIQEVNDTFQPEYEEAEARSDAWYEENYDAYIAGEISREDAEQHITGELDKILDRWKASDTETRQKAKELLDNYFAESAYDGLHIQEDAGSLGRSVETWIAFHPSQVKDTANKKPTGDPDIRYSLKEGTISKSYEALLRENDALRERVDYWKGQTRRTERVTTDKRAVEKAARDLIRRYGAEVEPEDIRGGLQNLFDYISSGSDGKDELTYTEARRRAESIARTLVENAVAVDDGLYQDYRDLRKHLRSTKLTISETDSRDIPGFNDFRKRNFGRLNIGKGRTNIDQAYRELAEMWPGLFNEQEYSHPADQLYHIAEVLDAVSSVETYNPFSGDLRNAVAGAANEIMELFFDLPQTRATFADRQAQKQDRLRAQNRELVQQAIERERAVRDRQLKRLRDHYARVQQDRAERQADSAARTRLLNIARRLQNRKLPAVNRALLDQYIGDLNTTAKRMTGRKLERLSELRDWYEEQKENDPDFIADPYVEKELKQLSKRQIGDMTADEVAGLTRVLLNIENELSNKRKLIDSEDRRDIYLQGVQTINDIENSGGNREGGVMGAIDKFIVTETLSPLRQIKRMAGYVKSDPLIRLTNALADGQRKALAYQMEAERPFRKWVENKKFSREFSGAQARTITITGLVSGKGMTSVEITPAMRASLYLHSLNDQNLRHIRDGGITVPDMKLYKKGRIEAAYARGTTIKLTPSQVRSITSIMTMEEKAFARAVHAYFNGQSRDRINEVSEKLKGYSIAQVENYFPINTDTSFTRADFETLKFDSTLEGMGFLKDRQEKASNPICLRDINDVLQKSIDQHSRYVGLAIPVRNFNKVWSVGETGYIMNDDGTFARDENGNRMKGGRESAVKQAVKQMWGLSGYKYIEKMMTDLQGSGKQKNVWTKALNRIRSSYAGAVLTLNASVAMKQAASYPTAAAVLGWGPLARAMTDMGKVDLDLIAKYTPLQWYRSKGFSTRELGDLRQAGGRIAKVMNSLPPVLNWVQGADLLTTRKLWKASEYYVRANNRELSVGTDGYYRAVAEIYNRVIEETQPNYTTMQRPQLLRSDDSLLGNLAMFKTQPFQNFNILYDAAGEYAAAKRNGVDVRTARRNLGNAVTSQLAQLAVFAGMTMAWAMFRGRREKYEDEDGEMSLQSVASALGKDMIGGQLSTVPFGSDAWELVSSKLFGDQYYGMDTVTVTAISDTIGSLNGMGELIGSTLKSVAEGEDINWNSARIKLDGYMDDISKAAGVPYENVVNLFNAGYRHACIAALGKYQGEHAALKLTADPEKKSASYYDLLYKAMEQAPEQYDAIYRDMADGGNFPEDKIKSAMEKRMKAAQGVEKVGDLDQRYLPPEQERAYSRIRKEISGTDIWRGATGEQRKKAEDDLYNIISGSEYGEKLAGRISGGAAYGIDEADYILYRLALHMVDQPTESGKLGTYTNEEVEAAINMLSGLSDKARGYLWETQGRSEKSNPYS